MRPSLPSWHGAGLAIRSAALRRLAAYHRTATPHLGVCLAALTITTLLTGCLRAGITPETRLTCIESFHCAAIVPPCGPDVTPDENDGGIMYHGLFMPRNVTLLTGIRPVLPTWLPQAASWYAAVLVGPDYRTPHQIPLLHGVYGHWPPQSGSRGGRDPNGVIALDETTETLDLLSNLLGDNQRLHIVAQRATTVLGQPATLAHLALDTATGTRYQGTELLWHKWPLTMRLFGSDDAGLVIYDPSEPGGIMDIVEPGLGLRGPYHAGDDDAVLLAIASSVTPYMGCEA